MRGSETIVVHPHGQDAVAEDWQGDPVAEDPFPPNFDRTYEKCSIWPRTSTEDSSEGTVIIDGLNVVVYRQDAEVSALDEVTARGERWAVKGVPGDYRKGQRRVGLIVVLERRGS